MIERAHSVAWSIAINAPVDTVWQHITEGDSTSLRYPAYLALLGIPKPPRAETTATGVAGVRTACFANGRRCTQRITAWQPPAYLVFTFHAEPGFRVGYGLNLDRGPLQISAGADRITPQSCGVWLSLVSRYVLRGWTGVALGLPTALALVWLQRHFQTGVRVHAERGHE